MRSQIRPFTPADYPGINEVSNAVYREYPSTIAELRFQDEHRDPRCKFQRWVAEQDGGIVGVGEYGQSPSMYHPRKFSIEVTVHPAWQGQGIGSALYDQVIAALQPFDPLSLRAGTREDMTLGVRFLERRGFREDMRAWESRLDVAAFDAAPYDGLEAQVRAQGIEIKTLQELAADPERDRKLYALQLELQKDVPHPEPQTPVSYAYFVEHTLKSPNLLPEAYFVAVHQGDYVGMSALWASQAGSDLYTGLTGVTRAYRRKGIALALKLRGIAYAKAHEHPLIKTWNESNNRAILAINERLGYVRQPAWITYVKVLKEEGY